MPSLEFAGDTQAQEEFSFPADFGGANTLLRRLHHVDKKRPAASLDQPGKLGMETEIRGIAYR